MSPHGGTVVTILSLNQLMTMWYCNLHTYICLHILYVANTSYIRMSAALAI